MCRASRSAARPLMTLAALAATLVLSGCATRHPGPISSQELASAQQFPYYKVYWDGLRFENATVTAADGMQGYESSLGDSVYYGDCNPGKGPLHTGGCVLPLQLTTVIYRQHSNRSFGAQRNLLIRGVPATIYNGGKSIEMYTGQVAIDIYADSPARARHAAEQVRPLNAQGSSRAPLSPPTFCPGLVGPAPLYRVARAPDGTLDCVSSDAIIAEG